MPGDHVIVGVLIDPAQHPPNAVAPIFVRMPEGGATLPAIHVRTLHNNHNINVRESRCYIPLENHIILIGFLEPNLHVIDYPSSTVVFMRMREFNNTLYSGVLRVGQGFRPDWLPLF